MVFDMVKRATKVNMACFTAHLGSKNINRGTKLNQKEHVLGELVVVFRFSLIASSMVSNNTLQ